MAFKRLQTCKRCGKQRLVYDHSQGICEYCFLISNNSKLIQLESSLKAVLDLHDSFKELSGRIQKLEKQMEMAIDALNSGMTDFEARDKALSILNGNGE